jgi:hypothetical protein
VNGDSRKTELSQEIGKWYNYLKVQLLCVFVVVIYYVYYVDMYYGYNSVSVYLCCTVNVVGCIRRCDIHGCRHGIGYRNWLLSSHCRFQNTKVCRKQIIILCNCDTVYGVN